MTTQTGYWMLALLVSLENPLTFIGLATALYWFARSSGTARKLKQFPTVGTTLPLVSLIGTVRFIRNVQSVVEEGTKKWPHRLFKIPAVLDWWIIVTNPKLIDEMSKAPEEVLSATLAISEHLQTRYTLGQQMETNPYHVPLVRGKLTRSIPDLMPKLYDEMVESFSEYIPATDDWSSVKLFDNATKVIACMSNRIIVGHPLCRNPEWIKLNIRFTTDVVLTGFLLSLFPTFIRPFLNFCFSPMPRHRREAFKLFESTITARRNEREQMSEDYGEKHNDFLSWLMDQAEGEEKDDRALLDRVLTLNFSAIHTSSLAVSHALFDLISRPEYLRPLREEVEEIIRRVGWTKSAVDQMSKIDSFVKESQRLHPIGHLTIGRIAINDYVFSDGQKVPAGTMLAAAVTSNHLNPTTYEKPLEFDGFRFLKMKERAILDGNPNRKFDMVSTSAQFLSFSHGRHACPGRFFAAAEIKMLLAYMIMTYDMKLVGGVRPPDVVLMNTPLANPSAQVLFRRRQC